MIIKSLSKHNKLQLRQKAWVAEDEFVEPEIKLEIKKKRNYKLEIKK